MNNELIKENCGKLFLKYTLPSILAMFVAGFYYIVDAVFIGQGMGTVGLGALSICLPVFYFINGSAILFGIGASTKISFLRGRGDEEGASKYFHTSVLCTLILGVTLATLALVFIDELIYFFGGRGELATQAKIYASVLFYATPLNMLGLTLDAYARNDGIPKYAMICFMLSSITNIIFDYVFIFIFDWGMFGGALATATGQVLSIVLILPHFIFKSKVLKLQFKKLKIYKGTLKNIIFSGLPSFFNQFSIAFIFIFHNNLIGKYGGDLEIAVYGIIANAVCVFYAIFNGVSNGIQPLISTNLGADKPKRVKKFLLYGILTAFGIGLSLEILLFLFTPEVASIFTTDKTFIQASVIPFRIYCCALPFTGVVIVTSLYFQCIGRANLALFTTLSRTVIYLLPVLFVLPIFFGMNGIWVSTPISEMIAFIVTIIILARFVKKIEYNV